MSTAVCRRVPAGARAIAWAVDVVLLIQKQGVEVDPSLSAAMPLVQPVLWAQAQHSPPQYPAIMERFNVHRSTAFRWMPDLQRAWYAVHPPRQAKDAQWSPELLRAMRQQVGATPLAPNGIQGPVVRIAE